jgi:hypothetical protein
MRNRTLAQYIGGGIATAEGFANLMGGTGFSGRRTTRTRTAANATNARSSGS